MTDEREKSVGQLISSRQYRLVREAIAGEIAAGAEKLRAALREETVCRTWNIGKILRQELGLGDSPSPENARLVALLCRDFRRPESFFYDAAKFQRLYPEKPPLDLSMAHYLHLIRIEDPKTRRSLERKIAREGLSAKALRLLTRDNEAEPDLVSGSGYSLEVVRGSLYHYRVSSAPDGDRVDLDIGFGIERNVRCPAGGSLHSGLMVRSVKEGEEYSLRIANFEKTRLYTYAAGLRRVVDGDTLVARIDVGFHNGITDTYRLRGIDAPELTCARGQKAKAFVEDRLASCRVLVIKSYKREKFRRFLVDVFYLPETDDKERVLREGKFLNQELLDEGLAVPYAD
ncbi:MAG: hypothetical protein BWY42_01699 [Candidatus Omnitrophica bacterium ADurb.Bin277]|nr:MAG: hypothetical protein BWY42_01699 [Candidatus Omnitrophica bacterium ADurb.Bin277]